MEAYVMDAFSARLFGGNQAGVVLPEHPLDDGVMQQIAAEFKHSETAFAAVEPDGSVTLRFDEPQRAPAPGQAAVLYDGELVRGGGTICEML